MPRWVLGCPECNQEFTHSEIDTEYRPIFLMLLPGLGINRKFLMLE